MAGAPGPNPLHGGGALEVGPVGFLGEPATLGLTLADGAANRLEAIGLVVGIASVGEEEAGAVEAVARGTTRGHRTAKKIHPLDKPNPYEGSGSRAWGKKTGEERRRDWLKPFEENRRRRLPGFQTGRFTRFSSRPPHD